MALPGATTVATAETERWTVLPAPKIETVIVTPDATDGGFQVRPVTEMDDRIVGAQIDFLSLGLSTWPQPIENLIGGSAVVPDPLALIIGPGLAVVEGAADDAT